MHMGSFGPHVQRVTTAQLLEALRPLAEAVGRRAQAGVPVSRLMREAALAGFLVGAGLSPSAALDVLEQGRLPGTEFAPEPPVAFANPDYIMSAPEPSHGPFPTDDLLRLIEANMQDEISTVAFYSTLLEALDTAAISDRETVRELIRHARSDEQSHYQANRELYRALTGRTYDAAPQEKPFTDLRDGFRKAMLGEYKAFETYREIYLRCPEERIRTTYFKLLTDELEHATFFNYALQVLA